MARNRSRLSAAAERLLLALAAGLRPRAGRKSEKNTEPGLDGEADTVAALLAADLACRDAAGRLRITAAGSSYLARREARRRGGALRRPGEAASAPDRSGLDASALDPFLVQHVGAATAFIDRPEGRVGVRIDEGESPLVWLARRKGRDGQPLITTPQLQAGERLRAEFTRAQLTPRVTSSWSAAVQGPRGEFAGHFTDMVIAARQRVRLAVEATGPEFSGLLLDVCCFLKRLEDVERERQWPARSAKVVLQLGLDRLARHFGIETEARGRARGRVRAWSADG